MGQFGGVKFLTQVCQYKQLPKRHGRGRIGSALQAIEHVKPGKGELDPVANAPVRLGNM
jgi:hypothetical protein